jgi:cysteate synthase
MAFAAEATRQDRACVIVITAETRARLRLPTRLGTKVHIVVVDGDARYDDAIAVSQALANDPRFVLEGGIRNIARRDGVGTVMLAALEKIGRLPYAYIQAVGSAAGAVAVHEMAQRALLAGYGPALPRLVLSQNLPFAPLVRSWNADSRELLTEDDAVARAQVGHIHAGVLSNLRPPYSISGGIHECLTQSRGIMLGVNNAAEQAMRERFWQEERILLDPAAAVAAASLAQLPQDIRSQNEPLLLHLTGAAPLENTSSFMPYHEYHIALADIKKADHFSRIRDEISAQ